MAREYVELYCEDCPDREGCMSGYPCELVKMVAASTAASGVPLKVTDPHKIDQILILFGLKRASK